MEIGYNFSAYYRNWVGKICVYDDVLKNGFGCVLMQYGTVVVCASCQLKDYECNYSTHDLKI